MEENNVLSITLTEGFRERKGQKEPTQMTFRKNQKKCLPAVKPWLNAGQTGKFRDSKTFLKPHTDHWPAWKTEWVWALNHNL